MWCESYCIRGKTDACLARVAGKRNVYTGFFDPLMSQQKVFTHALLQSFVPVSTQKVSLSCRYRKCRSLADGSTRKSFLALKVACVDACATSSPWDLNTSKREPLTSVVMFNYCFSVPYDAVLDPKKVMATFV